VRACGCVRERDRESRERGNRLRRLQTHANAHSYTLTHTHLLCLSLSHTHHSVSLSQTHTFVDGYCSTVQGLLDWFEVDLGFSELLFIEIDMCVLCDFVLYSRVSLSSCPFLDILHCLPRVAGAPLESALNLVSPMSPCGAYDTHSHSQTRIFSVIHMWDVTHAYV